MREACEGSLQRLRLERIDLLQLHRIDPKVPLEDQIGALIDLQREGKIRHIGLSEARVQQIEAVRKLTPIVSVQNRYNLVDRGAEDILDYCTRADIGFIPWFPLATGNLAKPGGPLERAAVGSGSTLADRTRLATPSFPGDAAHPRHVECRAPGGEHRCCLDSARRANHAGAGAAHGLDLTRVQPGFRRFGLSPSAISSIVLPVGYSMTKRSRLPSLQTS